MRFDLLIAVVLMITGIQCRRHHHYHYHLDNSTVLEGSSGANINQSTTKHQNQKISNSDPTIDVETFMPYSKHTTGRHVCTSRRAVAHPVKTVQTFCKPTFKKYMQRCNDNQLCTGVKLVYETAYRDVYSTKSTHQVDYVCCPGWTQINRGSHGCHKPLCSNPCRNGGSCVRPDTCSCPEGFKGRFCETDIDECQEEKPCDQICLNVPGSYKCDCRETFVLQTDGQSCRKEGEAGPGIEARDLEYEFLNKRLFKLESMLNNVQEQAVTKNSVEDINKKIESLSSDMKSLKSRIYDVETNQRDIRVMKNKISVLENKANKMDDLVKQYENGIKSSFNNRIYH